MCRDCCGAPHSQDRAILRETLVPQCLNCSNGLADSFQNVSFFVQFNQTDGKKNRYVPDDFEMDDDFKRLVSYNTTAVHIPTDIYEGCESVASVL